MAGQVGFEVREVRQGTHLQPSAKASGASRHAGTVRQQLLHLDVCCLTAFPKDPNLLYAGHTSMA